MIRPNGMQGIYVEKELIPNGIFPLHEAVHKRRYCLTILEYCLLIQAKAARLCFGLVNNTNMKMVGKCDRYLKAMAVNMMWKSFNVVRQILCAFTSNEMNSTERY